jgi:hypothetical protein
VCEQKVEDLRVFSRFVKLDQREMFGAWIESVFYTEILSESELEKPLCAVSRF